MVGLPDIYTLMAVLCITKDKGIKTPKDLVGKRLQYPGAPGLGGIIAKTMIEADV